MSTIATISNIRAEIKKHRDAAEKLCDDATAKGNDLSGVSLTEYNQHVSEIKGLNKNLDGWIAKAEAMASSPFNRQPASQPVASSLFSPANPSQASLSGRIRAAYAGTSGEVREQLEAFEAYIKGDIKAAANLTPTGDGAVIIPSFVVDAVERNYTDFRPVETVARIWGTDTGADVTFPVLSDSESAVQLSSAAATGADDTVSGDTPPTALTGPTLKAYKVSSKPNFIPRETATDSSVDIVGEIILAQYARIARFENLKYTRGTGTNEAEGFLTNATKFVTGAVALDLDIALDVAYSVPSLYRTGGVYMMTDTTARYLRKLKTGLSGDKRQLWADADATKGTPATLHGYAVVINNDMDDVSADGTFAAKNPLVFGNFTKFVIRKAEQGRAFLRRYEVPAKDGVAVITFSRSDSKLIVPAAISKVAVS